MPTQTIHCPRCGESLPAGAERCDSCGAYLVAVPAATSHGGAPRPRGAPHAGSSRPAQTRSGAISKGKKPRKPADVPGIAYLFLATGLVVGGMVGYTLHGSVGPREEGGGMPTGPADIMAGGGMGASQGGMGGGGVGAPGGGMGGGAMPADVLRMVQAYRAALEKNPDNVEANVGLGNLMFDSAKWSEAIEHYTNALKRDPGNPDVRIDRAIAYHNLGQDDQARAEMERVTKENPTHKNAWFNLGVVTAGLGDRATAVAAWEQFLKLEPSGERSDGIRQELARLKQP